MGITIVGATADHLLFHFFIVISRLTTHVTLFVTTVAWYQGPIDDNCYMDIIDLSIHPHFYLDLIGVVPTTAIANSIYFNLLVH